MRFFPASIPENKHALFRHGNSVDLWPRGEVSSNLLDGNFNEEVMWLIHLVISVGSSPVLEIEKLNQDSAASFQEALKAWRQGRKS